ncbi:formimidoylglutamase [Rapidithrix thailandica]|uniref:Formimidoylglutamase n=1 Tax=Rapidithrix thailandica TaxID=413964 RepID=A0AAW9SDZ6_9BACT
MYIPPTKQRWQGRIDVPDGQEGYRWHQYVKLLDLKQERIRLTESAKNTIAFLGFASDEGVRRNKGRTGAVIGPDHLRKALANLALHKSEKFALYDAGDVGIENQQLEFSQELLGEKVAKLLSLKVTPVLLGGGHEIAYGHFLGLRKHIPQTESIGIINFDAHFDLRSYETEMSSGTPFRQIADLCKEQNQDFHYCCFGIQETGNTQALFRKAEELGVNYYHHHQCQWHNIHYLEEQLTAFIQKTDHLYVTIDLDAFSAAYAPGVSAANGLGIHPEIALHLLQKIIESGKLLSLDIAELSPIHDIDQRTAKLAAQMIFRAVMQLIEQ